MSKKPQGRGSLERAATRLRMARVGVPRKRKPEQQAFDDNPEWSGEDFDHAHRTSGVHGPEIAAALVKRRGRPAKVKGERKEAVSLRLSPEVLAFFRSTGEGWQTRIDDLLKAVVRSQGPN